LFDLSFFKIAVLAIIAIVVFGPDQLPKMAAQAGRALRDVRRLAENARADLSDHLGPEFRDFDINELNPKYFVRKHLLDEVDAAGRPTGANGSANGSASIDSATNGGSLYDEDGDGTGIAGIGAGEPAISLLEPGEKPPYDAEAT
jgi:sec-independent protein translocase protein TatB